MRSYNKHKVDPRSIPCLFLGYSLIHKGYKCLCNTGRLYISRHVLFDESKFPTSDFLQSNQPTSNTYPTPNLLPIVQTSQSLPNRSNISRSYPINNDPSNHRPSNSSHPITPSSNEIPESSSSPSLPNIPPSTSSDQPLPDPISPSSSQISTTNNPNQSIPDPNNLERSFTTAPLPNSSHVANNHPMVTRGKSGIFKPKIFSAEYLEVEPPNVKESLKCPHWVQAMTEEYKALLANGTWSLESPPTNEKVIECKWIFKIKKNFDGSIAHYKARLVAQGYNQATDIDYIETFSPVVKQVTIRVLFTLALYYGWKLRQVDINNVFLHGVLEDEVYMIQPPGMIDSSALQRYVN